MTDRILARVQANAYVKMKRATDPEYAERRRDADRRYYQRNKETIKKKTAAYTTVKLKTDIVFAERHREFSKSYYHANKERMRVRRQHYQFITEWIIAFLSSDKSETAKICHNEIIQAFDKWIKEI